MRALGGRRAPLARIAIAQARRRTAQSVLMVLGIAVGVATIVAIDVASLSASAAFRSSTQAVAGRSTHRIVGGPTGLDEAVYADLRTRLGMRASAPVVQGPVQVCELGPAPMTLLGIDPLAEAPFRDFVPGGTGSADLLASMLTTPGGVVVSRGTSDRAGVATGDWLHAQAGGRTARLRVLGILEPRQELDRLALDGLLIGDVSTAQEVLGTVGRLDHVDLILPAAGAERDRAEAQVLAALPAGAALVPASEESTRLAAMTEAFELNLRALSLLALMVGLFLIHNTMRFAVVQRRTAIGTLRALGVTRAEICAMVLIEAAILGSAGSGLGLLAGVILARGMVELVTRTINDLYFVLRVTEVSIPVSSLVRAGLLGVVASIGAAVWPAREAATVPPVTALRRSDLEAASARAAPRALALAVLLVVAAFGLLALPGRRVDVGIAALAAVMLAFALTAPAVTLAAMAAIGPLACRLLGVVGRLAPRDVARALSRTAVAIAALALALSVSIGVALMVSSFRTTVVRWLADSLQADLFVAPLADETDGSVLDPRIVAELSARPQVARVATVRRVSVRSPRFGALSLLALSDTAGDRWSFVEVAGAPDSVAASMAGGAVMISEQLAYRYGLSVGDELVLVTRSGPRPFPVAAVVREYSSDQGNVFLASAVYRREWGDDDVSSLGLFLRPGADGQRLARELSGRLAGIQQVRIQSNEDLRRAALQIFDRAFRITVALELLAIAVAFVGVLAALMAIQLERWREFATLRATGMTARQLGALSLLETGLIGTVSGLLSWPAGAAMALLLIRVINRRSFGWLLGASFEAWPFARALAVAVGAALLAGIYPAWRSGRLPIARALREE